jgi:hypothetical protein
MLRAGGFFRHYCAAFLTTLVLVASPAIAQSQQAPTVPGGNTVTPSGRGTSAAGGETQPARQSAGTVSGTVIVQTGAVAVGAQVQLTRDGQSSKQQMLSGDNGEFSFANLPPGPFQITIKSPGFATEQFTGELQPGENQIVPPIMLNVAAAVTEVKVEMTAVEVAEVQIKYQEEQYVLGFIPNFYASYVPDAAPLPSKLKFQLAWKSVTNPMTIVGVGALAGIYQAADEYGGYGQGAEGYAKRFGATYGSVFIGTFIDSALLPSLLKQDPRYFYRGTGTKKSRLLYALGNAVMCKGDNKKYQVNYSAILGSFITSGIAYSWTPESDRSTSLYLQSALIRIAEGSVAGLFQEFVVKKLTPHLKKEPPPQP